MVDVQEHNGIKITQKGFAFLKKKESIDFRKVIIRQKAKADKPSRRKKPALEDEEDQELFEKLKEARQRMAKRRVPAYVIFHDKTLVELADRDLIVLRKCSRSMVSGNLSSKIWPDPT